MDVYEHAEHAERSYVCQLLATADVALARAYRGELDGAREALRPVLDVPPTRRARAIITSVMRVHTALRDARYRGSPAATHAQQQIKAFRQAPTPALPR